jgi:hypothetical protein
VSLDDPQTYQQLDPSGMLQHLHEFAAQCQRTWQNALKFDLPREYATVDKAIILGMGGSAIGGELLPLTYQSFPLWLGKAEQMWDWLQMVMLTALAS